jgi:hypothetical protein
VLIDDRRESAGRLRSPRAADDTDGPEDEVQRGDLAAREPDAAEWYQSGVQARPAMIQTEDVRRLTRRTLPRDREDCL